MRTSWLLGGVFLCACSSSSGSSTPPPIHIDAGMKDTGVKAHDAGASHDATHDATHDAPRDAAGDVGYPAPHAAMPQVVNSGGPVMTSPKFVIITFAGDALAPNIDDFADKVAASSTYWHGTTAEYGVGPVASVLHISVNEAPPPTLADSDVQTWITGKLSGPEAGVLDGGAPWPQPDTNTLYMVYYPDNVSITMGGGSSCDAFYGYHGDYLLTGTTYVTYSVVARCPPFPMTTAIDSVTAIASHELVEAATDPLAIDHPAYLQPDTADIAWAVPAGGEVGDLCAGYGNVFYQPTDVPYLLQRTWSNQAAAAGHDPCQPEGAVPYFNASVVFTDNVVVENFNAKGVKIPVGGTGTVEVELYSDGPTSGPWTIQASDLSGLMGGAEELEATFGGQSTATGVNGDKLTLTIKVLQQGSGGYEVLWLQSTLGQTMPVWLGAVGTP